MYRIDNEKFGAFVSELRREKGMTQKDLAQRLFVSDKAVSKWERGLSLPDISLLQPMADILGVSVTELLGGQRMADSEQSDREVEQIVESAVATLTAQEEERQRQNRRRWGLRYAAALVCLVLELLLSRPLWDNAVVLLLLPPFFGVIFGAHFCFFAKEKLPTFYDQYRINFYSEGAFRMNVPGVHFNNSNWPHILLVLRIWCVAMIAGWSPAYALVHAAAAALLPDLVEPFVLLFLFLPVFFGGLFGPVYVVGRKYE